MAFALSIGQVAISARAEADLESNRPLLVSSQSAATTDPLIGLWESLKKQQTQKSIITFLRVSMIIETVLTGIVYSIVKWATRDVQPTQGMFFERDLQLSFPQKEDIVSDEMLHWASCWGPVFTIALFQTLICVFRERFHCILSSTVTYLSVLMHSLMLSGIVVQVLKITIGEHRPHFFYACDYKGYRSAFDSGDLTSYMEKTVPSMIGSLEYCNAPYEEWRGAMLSFPSSHASLSFSGLLLLSLYLSRKFTPSLGKCASITATVAYKAAHLCLVSLPIILAIFISISRVYDYHHHINDVIAGSLIGSSITVSVWIRFSLRVNELERKRKIGDNDDDDDDGDDDGDADDLKHQAKWLQAAEWIGLE